MITCIDKKHQMQTKGFIFSHELMCANDWICVDQEHKKWCVIPKKMHNDYEPKIYCFTDVLGCELYFDDVTVAHKGTGRAFAGGMLFGNVGAIVGATTGNTISKKVINKAYIKVKINDMQNPYLRILLSDRKAKQGTPFYESILRGCDRILGAFELISNEAK